MPTYKPRYFAQVLESMVTQTYAVLQLVICDADANGAIEAVVASKLLVAPFPFATRNQISIEE
ncbi:hypothetical protein FYK61_10055 [Xanthomonas citri]|uniref:hypothetical protein n=1 Tax=Xanthomonas citri TaxID=346 RepID=UPI001885215E|nr:hypothetical protein [Xanthomonas citri]QOY21722.1 hypothetical protein FYK61_10055 [Xanthomonas citri]